MPGSKFPLGLEPSLLALRIDDETHRHELTGDNAIIETVKLLSVTNDQGIQGWILKGEGIEEGTTER